MRKYFDTLRKSFLLLLGIAFACVAANAQAQIANPSYEDPIVADGTSVFGASPDWTIFGATSWFTVNPAAADI